MKRQTFLEFCNEMRGLNILNKKDKIVPKYIAYHTGLDTLKKVKQKYLTENR